MKIGFVIDDGLDKADGVQQYVLTLGMWLTDQGHEVHYLAGETKRADIKNLYSLSRNLKVRFNANSLSTPMPARKSAIRRLLNRENYDVLHVQVPYSPFMAGRVISSAPKGTRIVGTFHIMPYGQMQRLATRLLGLYLRRNVKKFDQMLAVSRPAADFCRQVFGLSAEILPNVVDIKQLSIQSSRSDKHTNIVFMGRLVERKGCVQLVKAINLIHKNNLAEKPFRVQIGGSGPDRHKIESFIKKSGLKDVATMHGYIDEDSKPAFLASADIAVFPSIGGESFGIVLIEAMAAGAGIVIGGDNAGYRSVLKNDDVLIDASDHKKLARKLAELINNPSLRSKIHESQQKDVNQYDVNIVGTKLEKIYHLDQTVR